jgi:hypothetical protein
MKITELLAPQLNEAWYDPRTWSGASAPKSSTGGTLAATPTGTVHKASKSNPNAAKDANNAKLFDWIDRWIDAKKDAAARKASATEVYAKRAGAIGKILDLLGIGALIVTALVKLRAVEELYTTGQISEERYHDAREWYLGMFEVQLLIPAIVSKMRIAKIVGFVARLIVSLITLGGSVFGVTAPAALAALVAEQAFFTWLQWFLTTDTATKWLSQYFAMPIMTGGKLLDGAWDALLDHYKGAEQKKAVTPQKGTAGAAKPPVNAAKQQADDMQASAQAAEFNSRTRVMQTDPKTGKDVVGTIDPATDKFVPDPGQ